MYQKKDTKNYKEVYMLISLELKGSFFICDQTLMSLKACAYIVISRLKKVGGSENGWK